MSRCVEWEGFKDSECYGVFGIRGCVGVKVHKNIRVHRMAYEFYNGPIPDGLVIDHLCRNRACVNPDHLEAVTDRVNILRGYGPPAINARKTECKWGHPLSGKNLYVQRSTGKRYCVTCSIDRKRRFRARRKSAKK